MHHAVLGDGTELNFRWRHCVRMFKNIYPSSQETYKRWRKRLRRQGMEVFSTLKITFNDHVGPGCPLYQLSVGRIKFTVVEWGCTEIKIVKPVNQFARDILTTITKIPRTSSSMLTQRSAPYLSDFEYGVNLAVIIAMVYYLFKLS